MKNAKMRVVLLAAVTAACGLVVAGNLDPPGPPAPTMVTLQQIYDKLDACTGGGPCGVPKTGQTGCWDLYGDPISCGTAPGQDGLIQAGVSVAPRFSDNLDGTVTDNLTGLIWLKNANCFGARDWGQAVFDPIGLASGACGLTDGSVIGAWRLPNVREMSSLIDYGTALPALPSGHPFSGVQMSGYWSSTSANLTPDYAWFVNIGYGNANGDLKTNLSYVWPVRGGL